MKRLTLLMSALALTLTACVRPTGPGVALFAAALQPFQACEGLEEYAKTHALDLVGPYGLQGFGYWGPDVVFLEEGDVAALATDAAAPAAARGGGVAGVDYSTTNVQEVGVDEPDIIKTDGTRIFAIADGVLHYVDVSGPEPRLAGSLTLDNGWGEMFLFGDRLIVMGTSGYWGGPAGIVPEARLVGGGYSDVTVITEVDVSDAADMRATRTLQLDGRYLSARMTDGVARIVMTSQPTGFEWTYPKGNGLRSEREAEAANRQIIEDSTLENWVPYFVFEDRSGSAVDVTEGTVLNCQNAYHPEKFSGLGMLTVLTVDLEKGLLPDNAVGVMAAGETIYSSEDSLYVASQQWIDWEAVTNDQDAAAWSGLTTEIHKFDVSDPAKTDYRATGEVDGYLINQYAMSEHEGHLRVASTSSPPWWGWNQEQTTESFVTVLAENDGKLNEVGKVGDLGRGEQIYAVRFMGSMGYVVTFRQVDPLYTIDLSDPTAPAVVGELKINGYSAYLHPLADGLLLGIGQDATDEGRTLGTQVSIFDVADPAHPTRLHKLTIANGSSQVEWDARAFLYWPTTDLAVLPIQTWNWDNGKDEWFVGAVGVELDRELGITELGTVTHLPTANQAEIEEFLYDYGAQIQRSLVIGDSLFTMSSAGIKANDLNTLTEQAWVSFR